MVLNTEHLRFIVRISHAYIVFTVFEICKMYEIAFYCIFIQSRIIFLFILSSRASSRFKSEGTLENNSSTSFNLS